MYRESVGTAELAYDVFVRNLVMLGQPVVREMSMYLQMDSTHSTTFFFEECYLQNNTSDSVVEDFLTIWRRNFLLNFSTPCI